MELVSTLKEIERFGEDAKSQLAKPNDLSLDRFENVKQRPNRLYESTMALPQQQTNTNDLEAKVLS